MAPRTVPKVVDEPATGAALTPTSYLVLGLVGHLGSATSYDLKQAVAGTIGGFWSVPHSQLYAEPARLARVGFLTEERGRWSAAAHLLAHRRGSVGARRVARQPRRRRHRAAGPRPAEAVLGRQGRHGIGGPGGRPRRRGPPPEPFRARGPHRAPPRRTDLHQLSILALAARYETEAIAFWEAVAVDPDLT